MKSLIIASLLLGSAGAAQAGPYVNVEANSGFTGSDYSGTAMDIHVGYEGSNWYVQAGPVLWLLTLVTVTLNCLAKQVVLTL